ncbi:unnamed protein product [Sphagnum balticum]
MDRLKSLSRSKNYRQLPRDVAHPAKNNHSSSSNTALVDDADCNEADSRYFMDKREDVVLRICDDNTSPDLASARQGIWRECSYDLIAGHHPEVELAVAASRKNGRSSNSRFMSSFTSSSNEVEKSRRRGTSFDFGSLQQVDPPSRLIGTFLQRQKESGEHSLDMNLGFDLEGCCPEERRELNTSTPASRSDHESSTPGEPNQEPQEQNSIYSHGLRARRTSTSSTKPASKEAEKSISGMSDQEEEAENLKSSPKSFSPRGPSRLASGASTATPFSRLRQSGLIPRTGLLSRVTEEGELEEDLDPFRDIDLPEKFKSQHEKWGWVLLVEWLVLVLMVGALVCSIVIHKLKRVELWGLLLWKWVVVALVTICGRLVSGWVIRILVFFLERSFILRKRVLYFVYALRKGVQNLLWLAFVLITWHFWLNPQVKNAIKVLNYITKALVCFLIAAVLVVVKIFLVKVLASCFHVDKYFERIRDSLFNQFVLETLMGPPVEEERQSFVEDEKLKTEVAGLKKAETAGNVTSSGVDEKGISMRNLAKLNRRNVSAWNMKRLINLVKHTGVATLTHNIEDNLMEADGNVGDQSNREINSEWQAKVAAKQIFKNVARPGRKHITECDLLRFMNEEEVSRTLPLFDGAMETGRITPRVLKSWVVNVYRERRALSLSLSDTKTAVNKLHQILNVILFTILIIIWLLVLGIATKNLLVFVSSQLLLVVFIFGNTCKNIFEAIVFLFVLHPFDVGDRCIIDGTQMVVEEMNILSTIFIGDANVKVWYPNSVLATKPIQNFYRSPEMGDNFDFVVDASTPAEKIALLKERIGKYIQSKPHHWKAKFGLLVVDVEEINKLKLSLGVSHTMNYQDYGEKVERKSELLWEMRKIFEELGIAYHLPTKEFDPVISVSFPHLSTTVLKCQ